MVLMVRDGKVQRQQITLGLRGLAMSEVKSGLSEGDPVAGRWRIFVGRWHRIGSPRPRGFPRRAATGSSRRTRA